MLLCDAAENVNGKLYILGGGWTHLTTPRAPATMALGVVVAVAWEETNQRHTLNVVLLDDDGGQVLMQDQPVQTVARFEVGRPAGVKPGSDLNAVMAFQFQGLVLDPGGYVWELRRQQEPQPLGRTPFWVLDPARS